jgi:hypothetical protein
MTEPRGYRLADFPRADDGLGWAMGLDGSAPEALWERFSPAYEAQAQAVLAAMERLYGGQALLDWAGEEDGEAALALDADGYIVALLHLEDPAEAEVIAMALKAGTMDELLRQSLAG